LETGRKSRIYFSILVERQLVWITEKKKTVNLDRDRTS
jgi:hypothetical protein